MTELQSALLGAGCFFLGGACASGMTVGAMHLDRLAAHLRVSPPRPPYRGRNWRWDCRVCHAWAASHGRVRCWRAALWHVARWHGEAAEIR